MGVRDILGSASEISAISVTQSSLQSLNISRVGFNSGGSVNIRNSTIMEDLEMIDMAKMTSLAVKDSTSARVRIQTLGSVSGDLVIEGHELTGSQRVFELDLEDAMIGGDVVVTDIKGT